MNPVPLVADLVTNTPIALAVLVLSLAITGGWLYRIYQ
jgi:hypothetical protein